MIAIGLLPLLAPIITTFIYFTMPFTKSILDTLFDAFKENNEDKVNKALDSMNHTLREETQKILQTQKQTLNNQKYEIPLFIQFKQKIKNLLATLPADFPLQENFSPNNIDSVILENDNVRFRDFRKKKIRLFNTLMSDIFKISLETDAIPNCVDIPLKKLGIIMGTKISKTTMEAFYNNWKIIHETENFISDKFNEWANNNPERQKIINEILLDLCITHNQGCFTATYYKTDTNFDPPGGFNEAKNRHSKEREIYNQLQTDITGLFQNASLTQKYGSRTCSNLTINIRFTFTQQEVEHHLHSKTVPNHPLQSLKHQNQ